MVKENKKEDGVRVTYKELNNKSRKGLYAYVKEPKKPGRYYKVKDDVGKDDDSYLILLVQFIN